MNMHTALLSPAKTTLLKMLQRVLGFNAACVFLDACKFDAFPAGMFFRL